MSDKSKLPVSFWLLSGLALVWHLLGVMAFIEQITMSPASIKDLPQDAQDIYLNVPLWANIAFGSAVVGGALGCVALLLKKSVAFYLFLISLVSVCIQMFHAFFIVDSFAVFGPGVTIMPIMVILVTIALVFYAKNLKSKMWLN